MEEGGLCLHAGVGCVSGGGSVGAVGLLAGVLEEVFGEAQPHTLEVYAVLGDALLQAPRLPEIDPMYPLGPVVEAVANS